MGLIRIINRFRHLSVEDSQRITKQQLTKMVTDLFDQMLAVYSRGQKLVYDNPLDLTPQQVLEGLGNDRNELLRLGMLLKDCINLAVPGTIVDTDEYGTGGITQHNISRHDLLDR